MADHMYYILGGIITGGAVISFIFSYYQDYREQSSKKRRTMFSRINGDN